MAKQSLVRAILVVVPVWQVRRVLAKDPRPRLGLEGPGTSAGRKRLLEAELTWTQDSIQFLGGPQSAAAALRFHLRLPDFLAADEEQVRAIVLLARCGREAKLHDPSRYSEARRVPPPLYFILPGKPTPAIDQVVEALTLALADESVAVRAEAVRSLGWLGPCASDAAPAIATMRQDEDPDVRDLAAWALEQIEASGSTSSWCQRPLTSFLIFGPASCSAQTLRSTSPFPALVKADSSRSIIPSPFQDTF